MINATSKKPQNKFNLGVNDDLGGGLPEMNLQSGVETNKS